MSIRTVLTSVLLVACCLSACSSEQQGGAGGRVESGSGSVAADTGRTGESARGPYSLEVTPQKATAGSALYLNARGIDPSDSGMQWLVNGAPVPNPTPYEFKASDAKKGDKVQVRAMVKGREVLSNIVEIKNAPPEISKVRILPEVFRAGDTLYAEAEASDADGDEVVISYEWTRNGEPSGTTKSIETPVRRGDKLTIRIVPFDGELYGNPVTLNREIRNLPPTIIDDRKFSFDGRTYIYQVKASDPDDDILTYSIKSGPGGMTIDPQSGRIRWNVPQEFTGSEPVTVSVTDGNGGEATYNFKVTINPGKAGQGT